jgi:hypothetical protein
METGFPLGQTVITRAARDVLHPEDVVLCLARHTKGDWGDLDEHDRNENEIALVQNLRLFSVYHDRAGVKFYIITEWDRSVTTTLLPEDY